MNIELSKEEKQELKRVYSELTNNGEYPVMLLGFLSNIIFNKEED